jgi:catechol 2,3-dioxygenase-like lactoylglutathione lyase family enzyme
VSAKRVVPNLKTDRPGETCAFYTELLGLDVAMDQGWVATLVSPVNPAAQVTIVSGDDPAAPGITVEVDDVDAMHARAAAQGRDIFYPLRTEPWGVRRFMVRDPAGTVVNVLSHA